METLTIRELREGKGFLSYQNRDLFLLNRNKENDNDIIVNFAYTDYGGSFYDNVCIEYFEKFHSDSVLTEITGWNGKNAILFGNVAKEFINSINDYCLGYDNLEEFYYNMQNELEEDAWEWFINDELTNYYDFDKNEVLEYLRENKAGYYRIYCTMLDFNSSDLIQELENAELIEKSND